MRPLARRTAVAPTLTGGRLHLQDGPIDLVIKAEGAPDDVQEAYRQAITAFEGLLAELARELPELRRPLGAEPHRLRHPVARAMAEACRPHERLWVTPMAAVAGSIADHVLAALIEERSLTRAWVNDGGDIAVHLAPGESLDIGLVADLADWGPSGQVTLTHDLPTRGLATSGRQGRSLSRGLADAVTVLAASAAEADVAATLIANAVDLEDHPNVRRRPACEIDSDSDLSALPVVTAVGPLSPNEIETALTAGAQLAAQMHRAGLIHAALLSLREQSRAVPDRQEETSLPWT
ncbi:UPF0280 family protein [Algihabitans albus]|uniref:UPF0280 family protein n=1 Tax=Algihabitans albus TaxID=2164067 RepID=UPI000E5CBD96|nr:UPF0280 family protein [Algihabitans albus]